jgi:hypothetical protein
MTLFISGKYSLGKLLAMMNLANACKEENRDLFVFEGIPLTLINVLIDRSIELYFGPSWCEIKVQSRRCEKVPKYFFFYQTKAPNLR